MCAGTSQRIRNAISSTITRSVKHRLKISMAAEMAAENTLNGSTNHARARQFSNSSNTVIATPPSPPTTSLQ